MNSFLATLSVMVVTFFYLLLSDDTTLDFINKMADNFFEVAIFLVFMITVGWGLYFLLANVYRIIISKPKSSKSLSQIIDNKTNNSTHDEPLTFYNECKEKDSQIKSRYCQSVLNLYKLVKETSKDENYKSIAVTGEWGSGKSSVLLGLKKLLQIKYNSYIVIYINVWKYKETSQIITSLQNELNKKFPDENLFVIQYLDVVASWYGKESFLQKILLKETQEEFESRIIKQITNKRLVIMIDEIDRIVNKTELMEVLKLIKVHSGIKKTTVITAISQKHFLQTMGETDPKYLQKYFYYTFPVPSFLQEDFLQHNYQIFKTWESSGNYLEKAYWAMRDMYFKNEIWKYISNHREAKQLFSFLNEQLTKIINSQKIVQEDDIVKKYSIVFFYFAFLHTTNLGLYLQLETIDEKNNNEIIKMILKDVNIHDLKQLLKEFKQRNISFGSHPWFLISHYVDTNKYGKVFNDLHTKHNNNDREHYKLVLECINFEQLEKIKEYLPYFLNASEWVYQTIERLDKHEEFKALVVEGFASYKGQERFKKLSTFIADIESKNLEKWNDISWKSFTEHIIEDIKKNDFSSLTLDQCKISQTKKDELKELLRPHFESNTEQWKNIEDMVDLVFIAGEQ